MAMTDPADRAQLKMRVAQLIDVLTRFAAGDWQARAGRDGSGDPWDVLAYMINATIEEIGALVGELRRQRETLELTQRQLVHSAKLAALGELAGGVAHELNQPLTAIVTLVDLARQDGGHISDDELQLISDAALRMATIVGSVRAFARQSELRMQPVDPVVPVEAALRLMAPSFQSAGITVVCSFAGGLPRIAADESRLQQVFVNLLANARDALMEVEGSGRRIEVDIHSDGSAVIHRIRDNGRGVAPELCDRVFEPFFTTKPVGAGTGLGLSVSYGIVQDHGGTMTCEQVATGASFTVRLPALAPEAA